MEYLIGFFSAFLLMYCIFKIQSKNNIFQEPKIKPLKYSQSHIHSIVFPLLPKNKFGKRKKKSQAVLHESKTSIKVIIMENSAYWIKDNVFYMADMSIDGMVDKDTTRRVDTMAMSRVQLDKMMFIIDRLREENYNDSSGPGDQQL
jgi:hypothetical protein